MSDWRDSIPGEDLDHWEHIWKREQEVGQQEKQDRVSYRYLTAYEAINNRSLIGKRASHAYWISDFARLPWGHPHAHTYAFAFKEVTNVGIDFLVFVDGTSKQFGSYDMICVQDVMEG